MQSSQLDISEISWEDLKFNAFTEDELDLLKLFHEQATQITDTYFMKNGTFKSSSVIQVDRIKGESTPLWKVRMKLKYALWCF